MFAFFENLHIDLNVAIERRENFDATTGRETISAQDIDFFDVAVDEKSDEISKKVVVSDSTTDFDDVENDKEDEIDRNDEENESIDCFEANFDSEICAKIFDFFS